MSLKIGWWCAVSSSEVIHAVRAAVEVLRRASSGGGEPPARVLRALDILLLLALRAGDTELAGRLRGGIAALSREDLGRLEVLAEELEVKG